MRKVVANLLISLDGVVESPEEWHFPYLSDEMQESIATQIAETDLMLFGRNTYNIFADSWGTWGSEVPFADDINATHKIVLSNTLTHARWRNSTLIDGELAPAVEDLQAQGGKNIAVSGSVTLVQSLLNLELLDELNLLVHPLVLGAGRRLFPEGCRRIPFRTTRSRALRTGVLDLKLEPVRA